MKRILFAILVASFLAAGSAKAADVTLNLHYAHPNLWAKVQELVADAFMKKNPDLHSALKTTLAIDLTRWLQATWARHPSS